MLVPVANRMLAVEAGAAAEEAAEDNRTLAMEAVPPPPPPPTPPGPWMLVALPNGTLVMQAGAYTRSLSAQLERFVWDRGCAEGLCSPC
jgi:hypothetical protein